METRGYRSPFWPIVLIGIGLLWLLANLGIIPPTNLLSIFRLWPLLLIMIGLDILIGRRSAWVGALLGVIAVAIVIFLLVAGPLMGLPAAPQVKSEQFTTPLAGTESARIAIDLGSSPAQVDSLADPTNLIDAQIDYVGDFHFDVSGEAQKTVSISEDRSGLPWTFTLGTPMEWRIGLSPQVPLDLALNGGSGSGEFDLSQLNISRLTVDLGSGSMDMALPVAGDGYDADIQGGSGALEIQMSSGPAVRMRIDGGSGSITVDVSDDAAVRFDVQDSGSGSVSAPSGWEQVQEGDDDEGVWESPGADQATQVIEILVVDVGSGSIRVR